MNGFFSSTFYARATLKSDISIVESYLNRLRYLKKIASSKALIYEISNPKIERQSTIEISSQHINLQFFFREPSIQLYRDNLLTFISLIGMLNNFYEVQLSEIYKYVIDSLGQTWQNTVKDQQNVIENLKYRIKNLDESNFILSNNLINLIREKAQLSIEFHVYKDFCNNVIANAKEKALLINSKHSTILTEMGIELELIKNAESILNSTKKVIF